MRAPATTVFPFPPPSRNPLARFSLLRPLNRRNRRSPVCASSHAAARVLAVHEQRSSDPERHLSGADRILHVAAHLARRDRTRSDQRKRDACLPLDPIAALADVLGAIALISETRNQRNAAAGVVEW